MKRECANCGSTEIQTRIVNQAFNYRKNRNETVELSAEVPVRRCSDCRFEFLDYEADDVRHEAVCRFLNVMTPSEVESVRRKYGLTRRQFAEITRIGEASLSRWETGELIQNAANDELLYLLSFPENLARLQDRRLEINLMADKAQTITEEVIELGLIDRFPHIESDEVQRIQKEAEIFHL